MKLANLAIRPLCAYVCICPCMCVCVHMFLMSFFKSILLFKLKEDIAFRLPRLNSGMPVKSEIQLKMFFVFFGFFSHISISHAIFGTHLYRHLGFPGGSAGKIPPAMSKTWVWSLDWEDPLEKGMGTHSCIRPGEFHGLHSLWGSRKVGHDWAAFTFTLYRYLFFVYMEPCGFIC